MQEEFYQTNNDYGLDLIHPHPTVTELILEVCKRAVNLAFDKG